MPMPRSQNLVIAFIGTLLLACAGLLSCNSGSADEAAAIAVPDGGDGVVHPTSKAGPSGPPAKPVKGAGFTCEVKKLLTVKCQTCHTNPPTGGALVPLTKVQDMLNWSVTDPSKTVAQVALARMQSKTAPMPPADFHNPATPDEIQAFEAWTQANFMGFCQGAVPPNATCTTCHGDSTRVGIAGSDAQIAIAPPHGSNGELLTSQPPVGAHMAHLNKTDLTAAPLKCNDCHTLPTTNDHATGVVQIAWGPIAKAGGATPDYNGTTCTNVYCHGAFVGGRNVYAPAWTGGAMNCGSCHGTPPPTPPHTNPAAECSNCHGAGYSQTAKTVNKATHINGVVDVSYAAATCATCHGDNTRVPIAGADTQPTNGSAAVPLVNSSPPFGTHGESAATTKAVGAHTAHLNQTTWSANPIKCAECHQVPTSNSHADGTVHMLFGPFAKTGGANPAWNGTTCANVYCHGSFAGGATTAAPSWATPGGVTCGSCHALPPATQPHAANPAAECSTCHGPGYSQTAKTVDKTKHINGVIDVSGGSLNCNTCHGDTAATRVPILGADPQVRSSPPHDSKAQTATTLVTVGVHQAHVNTGTFSNPILCNECHVVPISNSHANGTINMTFGTLAKTGGVTPVWNAGTASCTNNYCHGDFIGGNTAAAPVWTAAGALSCTSCHGNPPATAPHSNPALACNSCHGAGYTSTTVNKPTHVDGIVQVDTSTQTCSSCHGDSTRVAIAGADPALKASPPVGTKGETLVSSLAVGMHQGHLNTGTFSAPTACADCHVVPIRNNHATGTIDHTFGALAKTGGVTPVWNVGTATCTSSYCHGNFSGGNTAAAPNWTSGTVNCTSCHGNPPATPPHSNPAIVCSACHGPGYSSTAVNLTTHLNGVVNVSQTGLTCSTCHGTSGRVGIAGSDPQQASAPPLGVHGETATSSVAVGAHQAHLNQKTLTATPVQCNACHAVPSNMLHATGTVTVTFGAMAKTGGVAPTWNGTGCAATYCHGNFPGGATTGVPAWTSGPTTCTSCHGDPPNTGKHGGPHGNCPDCHGAGYTKSAVDLSLHINGKVESIGARETSYNPATKQCTSSCHGPSTW